METIRSVAQKTANLLMHSCDYREINFHKLFAALLPWPVHCEVVVPFVIDGIPIGSGRIDCLTNGFIIEIKAVKNSMNNMNNFRGQVKKYLKHYSEEAVGVLIVFNMRGGFQLEIISVS